MPRLTDDVWQLIHVRLLTIIEADLKISFCGLSYFIKTCQEDCYHDNSFISEIRAYIKSSQLTCKDLKEWTEFQLLGPKVYSSNLRFQTHVIIQIIKANNYQNAILINKVLDYKEHKIDLTLFGFILRKLLLFLLSFSKNGELHISSALKTSEIIICIEDFSNRTVKELTSRKEYATPLQRSNTSDVSTTLHLCYEILRYYGGNLWVKVSENEGSKVYFSIPILKPYN